MRERVIADPVAFSGRPAHQIGAFRRDRLPSHHKEGSLDVVPRQALQHHRSYRRLRPVVESQRDL